MSSPAEPSLADAPLRRRSALASLRSFLPEGRELPEADWQVRHRIILVAIFAHAAGLAVFGLWQGWPVPFAVGAGLMVAFLGAMAAPSFLGRRFRSSVAALGLATSSAILVQFSGGYIEAHFHYFVVVAVVALYQDWAPFLLSIVYVAANHGIVGTIYPEWVYNHPAGVNAPWTWAAIHAVFVLAECAALAVVWRTSEQARARTELVLRSTGDGLLGVGRDGRITFANPAALAMTARPEASLLGQPVARLFSTWPLLSLRSSEGRAAETTLLQDGAGAIPVEVVATQIVHNGEEQGSVIAFRDITERRRAEAERQSRLQRETEILRLEEEASFKTLFINTAAHELRTPLTALKLQVHVLRNEKRGALNPEQKRIAEVLGRNLDRLGQLVEDVLDVGRIQARRLLLERQDVPLHTAVAGVAESFQELAARNGIALSCGALEPLVVPCDARRVEQVLINLVDNALKFTPPGGRVELTARRDGGMACVEVRDTGIGLSQAAMARLFQPFSQVHDTMQTSLPGSGLGLYISRGLAELHGGTLEVASPGTGHGASFTLRLPLAAPAAMPPVAVAA